MSVPRRSARQSDDKNHRAEIMETRRSGAHLESSPAKKGIKRDIFARKEGSSLETSKSKLHKSEIKIESSDGAALEALITQASLTRAQWHMVQSKK